MGVCVTGGLKVFYCQQNTDGRQREKVGERGTALIKIHKEKDEKGAHPFELKGWKWCVVTAKSTLPPLLIWTVCVSAWALMPRCVSMCGCAWMCVCVYVQIRACVRCSCLLCRSQIETWKKCVGRWWQEWSEPVVSWRLGPDVLHTEPQNSAAHFCLITRIFNQGRREDGGWQGPRGFFCACVLTCMHKYMCAHCLFLLRKWVCVSVCPS